MEINLHNKNALVGASTRGIGLAIAQQLASCGASVTLMARNEDKLKHSLSQLDRSASQQHRYLVVDFSNYAAMKTATKAFLDQYPIDILVNNTNGPKEGHVLETSETDYQDAFQLLFQTHLHISNLVLPHMLKNKWGRIINVASLTVKEPAINLVLSNTIRTALMSWSKSLAQQIANQGITVNSILTGMFDTKRIRELAAKQAKAKKISIDDAFNRRIQQIPMKRLGQPVEYGYLVAFLASDLAAYITGAEIPLDGGLMKGF
ncbi:SDR family oxidoreductase [Olivibacter ginsenosidimutans]|uniref:SDR family oxidoreductase n=1 Tax=Olivibacter ginsenosidimutans TaxID=1176537 RepID=A0ABP9B4P4_9SPHI